MADDNRFTNQLSEPELSDMLSDSVTESYHTCIICNHMKQDGIMICSEFICMDCESEMVRTDVMDMKYPFFVQQMKQIWMSKNA